MKAGVNVSCLISLCHAFYRLQLLSETDQTSTHLTHLGYKETQTYSTCIYLCR